MRNNKNFLDTITWSFSSVNAYDTCPKMFYFTYIEKAPKIQNSFSEWGTFVHLLLQKYYEGELELFELSGEYEKDYSENVKLTFPDNAYVDLNETYKAAGKKYFDNFEDDFSDYEVIGVEQKIETKIGKYNFVGYIDLILKDDKGYYICDHKSKSKFKNAAELRHYLFQLYIYSKYIYEKYGEYPVGLIYNMVRVEDIIHEVFDIEEYQKALSWAESTINNIYEDEIFDDKILMNYMAKRKDIHSFKNNDFFCNELCSVRESCERSSKR